MGNLFGVFTEGPTTPYIPVVIDSQGSQFHGLKATAIRFTEKTTTVVLYESTFDKEITFMRNEIKLDSEPRKKLAK